MVTGAQVRLLRKLMGWRESAAFPSGVVRDGETAAPTQGTAARRRTYTVP